jgi:hypothetical protein
MNAPRAATGGASAVNAGTSGASAPIASSGGAAAPLAGAGGAGMSAAGAAGASPPAIMGPATFTNVWQHILVDKGCSSTLCHGMSQGNLTMTTPELAYKNLVGVAAAGPLCGASGKLRVKPSDPDASLMLDKISHPMPACGMAMPVAVKFAPDCVSTSPTVCTTTDEIMLVHDWIARGAPND